MSVSKSGVISVNSTMHNMIFVDYDATESKYQQLFIPKQMSTTYSHFTKNNKRVLDIDLSDTTISKKQYLQKLEMALALLTLPHILPWSI